MKSMCIVYVSNVFFFIIIIIEYVVLSLQWRIFCSTDANFICDNTFPIDAQNLNA